MREFSEVEMEEELEVESEKLIRLINQSMDFELPEMETKKKKKQNHIVSKIKNFAIIMTSLNAILLIINMVGAFENDANHIAYYIAGVLGILWTIAVCYSNRKKIFN